MAVTYEQPAAIKERLKDLPAEIVELFEYDTIGVVLDEIKQSFELTDDEIYLLRIEVELILSLYEMRYDLTERLEKELGIDAEKALSIKTYLDDNLFLVVETILEAADYERLINEFENIQNEPSNNLSLDNSVESKESDQVVKPLRTFAKDVDISRAHSYGSYRGSNNPPEVEEDIVHRSSQHDVLEEKS